MELLNEIFGVINYLLYMAFSMFSYVFAAFDLNWLAFVVGLVVISAILRLFVANLVGSAISVHDHREKKQYRERQKARKANNSPKNKSGKE